MTESTENPSSSTGASVPSIAFLRALCVQIFPRVALHRPAASTAGNNGTFPPIKLNCYWSPVEGVKPI